MDSLQVLSKLLQLIQTISSAAAESRVNAKNCVTFAACVQRLAPVILEVQRSRLPIIGGSVTSFEGLEHALCKAKVWIQKCGGETSRVYATLRRERFTEKFKLLAAEIGAHVNSLPLGALELTDSIQNQMKEYISNLNEAIYDAEGDNELRLQTQAVLKELKEGVKLSHETLADLSLKFHLDSNQDILREAALLEKEKELVRIERDKHEEELINQLIVLVTKMGDDLAEQKQAQVELCGIPIPADFRCPLSLELMSDPVIVASGQTYEREYIQQWLDQGNTTCPKTRQTLNHTNLIPNYTVKALIANWCEANKVLFPEANKLSSLTTRPALGGIAGFRHYTHRSSSNALNGGMHSDVLSRRGNNTDDSMKSHSRNTSSSSVSSCADDTLFSVAFDENSSDVVQSNGVSLHRHAVGETQRSTALSNFDSSNHGPSVAISFEQLALAGYDHTVATPTESNENDEETNIRRLVGELQSSSTDIQRTAATTLRLLAKQSAENRILIANCGAINPLVTLLSSPDLQTQENAVTGLLNLSINDNNKNEIAAAGAIAPLVEVLRFGTSEAKENAAATLFSLSVMDENKIAIGQSGAIPPLVDLLKRQSPRGKKDATIALFNLSIHHANKPRIVSAGAIRPLVELISDPASGMVDKAVAVLANLSTIPEGRTSIGEEDGIPALVEVVELGSQKGKENAAAALLHLCTNNHRFRAIVLREGAIPPLVALSQSGTPRAKEKASSLLRHFREQRQQAAHGRGVR